MRKIDLKARILENNEISLKKSFQATACRFSRQNMNNTLHRKIIKRVIVSSSQHVSDYKHLVSPKLIFYHFLLNIWQFTRKKEIITEKKNIGLIERWTAVVALKGSWLSSLLLGIGLWMCAIHHGFGKSHEHITRVVSCLKWERRIFF